MEGKSPVDLGLNKLGQKLLIGDVMKQIQTTQSHPSESIPKKSTKEKKIILLGAGYTTMNMGVWALASGALTSTWHSNPTAKIYFLDFHSKPERYEIKQYGGAKTIRLINIRFSKKVHLKNNIARLLMTTLLIRLIPFNRVRNKLYSRNYYLNHVQTADLIYSIAGGDSFSDIYGLRRLIYVALPQVLALLNQKKLILLPQTIGPFNSFIGKAIAKHIIRRAYIIYSRDYEGLNFLKESSYANNNSIAFCHDLGFVLAPSISKSRIPGWLNKIEKQTILVGINVSGLLAMGGYTRKNMFGIKCDYSELIKGLINHFLNKHNIHIMLIPHVFGGKDNAESDVYACNKLFDETNDNMSGRLNLIDGNYNHHEIKALIGRCDFFIGSRMHACIAALSQSIPAIGLAYSRKFEGVFQTIGMEKLVLDLSDFDKDSIISQVESLYSQKDKWHAHLKKIMPDVRNGIFNILKN